MRRFLIPLLCATLCCAAGATALGQNEIPAPGPAQNPPSPPAPVQNDPSDPQVDLIYPNNPVTDILNFYETLTGKVLIRDANMTGANISIIVNKKIPRSEAIRIIEASLLLNGFSLVPDSDNRVKVINSAAGGKNPRSEGVPLYANAAALPAGNQVVSYFMRLQFLASADALTIFQQHVVLHPGYGSIISVPNAQALVITENVSLIRQLINLQELIDVPPARVISEFIILKRADAERVAETINKLIDAEKNDKKGGANPAAAGQPQPPNPQGGAPAPPPPAAGGGENQLFENELVAGSVQLIPDARTNRILVITRPVNFPYIRKLIEEFDEVVGSGAPLVRPLKYVSASEVLPVLADLLVENETGGTRGQGAPTGATGTKTPAQQAQATSYNNSSTSGLNGSSSGSGLDSHPDILSEPEDTGPTSVLVGKTHLIADNKANAILVIGPPESQEKVRSILDNLDKKPPQVYLSTVIGQFKLLNNNESGIDYVKLFQNVGGGRGGIAGSSLDTPVSLANLVTPRNLVTASAIPLTGGLSLYGTIGQSLSIYVHALESTNRFKVLARPVVYTANNKKATISSGQRVAVPTSTLSNLNTNQNSTAAVASNIEYQDVVLKLEVIPLINANNEVNLKIAQVDDSVAGSQTIAGNTVPTISTQQITTTVTVKSGYTVVLGGLITESTTNNMSGIPVLMHLPWVGPLFRDTTHNKERDELIIFIQPTVVQTDPDILAASESEKNRADTGRDAFQFGQAPLVPQTQLNSFYPNKTAPSKGLNK